MRYKKFEGNDWLARSLVLRNKPYSIVSTHVEAAGGTVAFAAEGRKAVVYKLKSGRGTYHALKVFNKRFALFDNFMTTLQLLPYSQVAGLRVCDRAVLLENEASILNEPGLAFAVLMPWMPGKAWADIVAEREVMSQGDCIALAGKCADVLAGLEARGLSHADISSGNVFVVTGNAPTVELIDVEDMYHARFRQPVQVPAGTPGYNYPRSSQSGNWNPYGDRFAAAVILAEMLTWHQPEIRAARDELSYFHRDEMCQSTPSKYDTMKTALRLHSPTVANLFQRAWESSGMDRCPSLDEWRIAMAAVKRTATVIEKPRPALRPLLANSPFNRLTNSWSSDTVFLSDFTCFECGNFVTSGNPGAHKETCSQHVTPTFDFGRHLWDAYRISGIETPPPTPAPTPSPSKKPAGAADPSRCPECGNMFLGSLGFFHKPTCSLYTSSYLVPTAATPSTTKCSECGNEVSAADGSDHRLMCSKHPSYSRSQPSRFRNVRFMPLTDPEPPKPSPGWANTSIFDGPANPGSVDLLKTAAPFDPLDRYLLGVVCSECKKRVVLGSSAFAHAPSCSKRGIGV